MEIALIVYIKLKIQLSSFERGVIHFSSEHKTEGGMGISKIISWEHSSALHANGDSLLMAELFFSLLSIVLFSLTQASWVVQAKCLWYYKNTKDT